MHQLRLNILLSINKRCGVSVLGDLFNDYTGWLVVGIIVFMLGMMGYLFNMFVSKSSKGE